LRSGLRRQLHLLHRRLPATMMYVTHDPAEAMILADRVVVLETGSVQQVGKPLDVYRRPANRFVAGFFGWPPMNLVEGRLFRNEDGLRLSMAGRSWHLPTSTGENITEARPTQRDTRMSAGLLGQSWPVPADLASIWQAHAGKPVTVGIRPNDLRLGMKLDP